MKGKMISKSGGLSLKAGWSVGGNPSHLGKVYMKDRSFLRKGLSRGIRSQSEENSTCVRPSIAQGV